jgi:hypothetical protein
MFTSAYKRLLQRDFQHNPFIGNFQYKGMQGSLSPTCTYSSPYIGSVDHSRACDYYEVRERQQTLQDKRIKTILVELSRCKDGWVTVSIEKPTTGSASSPAS